MQNPRELLATEKPPSGAKIGREGGLSGAKWVMAAAAALVAVVVAVALSGCGGAASAQGNDGSSSQSNFVSGDGTAVLLPASERAPAPAVSATTLDGKPFVLADYRGEVVAMNLWASWCAPCRAEAPALSQVSSELAGNGVQFIGLNTRDQRPAAEAFIRRFQVAYPNVADDKGEIQLSFRGTLPPTATPSTILIDKEGRVAGRILGEVDRSELREMLSQLAAEPGPAVSGAGRT